MGELNEERNPVCPFLRFMLIIVRNFNLKLVFSGVVCSSMHV